MNAIRELVRDYTISNMHIPSGMELLVSIELIPSEVFRIVDKTKMVHPEKWNLEAKPSFLKYSPRSNRVANTLNFYEGSTTTVLDVFKRLKGRGWIRGVAGKSKSQLWEWLETLNITPGTQIPDEVD